MISAGASILGGIFGNKPKKTTSSVNYVQLVKNAEAAGFNPLTALRNGGAAGFSSTTTPALSTSEVIGDAAGKVAQFLQDFDPMADDKREAEYKLVQAQIANLNASTSALSRPQSFNVPSWTANSQEQRESGVAGRLSASGPKPNPVSAGMPMTPEVERPKAVNPFPADTGIMIDPNVPGAQGYEDYFSEPGSWLGGVYNGYRTLRYNAENNPDWAPPGWVPNSMRLPKYKTQPKPHRSPPDPYDMKLYIPPVMYGGPSYQ